MVALLSLHLLHPLFSAPFFFRTERNLILQIIPSVSLDLPVSVAVATRLNSLLPSASMNTPAGEAHTRRPGSSGRIVKKREYGPWASIDVTRPFATSGFFSFMEFVFFFCLSPSGERARKRFSAPP